MEQLQLVLSDGGDVPPEDEMDEASDRMYADLEEMQATQKQAMRDAFAGGMQDLDRIVNSAQSQIQLAVQQILTGLQTVSNDIDPESQNLSAEYTNRPWTCPLNEKHERCRKSGLESADKASLIQQHRHGPRSELMQNLDASKNNVIAQLTPAKSAGTEMKSSADSAAAKAKEKPWYKKYGMRWPASPQ